MQYISDQTELHAAAAAAGGGDDSDGSVGGRRCFCAAVLFGESLRSCPASLVSLSFD